MNRLEDTSTTLGVAFAIGAYSLCSSTLLLANKMAIAYFPYPSVVSFFQIIFAAVILLAMKVCGVKIDDLDKDKLKAYGMYIFAFVTSIYANMQALKYSNVETVIVFRACSPIAVSIIEYLFMGRELPNTRSSISLLVVAAGAVAYCLSDSEFALKGFVAYQWAIIYFFLITFEMTYGKSLTANVKMESVWGPVLYCNLLAAFPMYLFGYFGGEYQNISEKLADVPANGMMILAFSCVAGLCIGYTTWWCRGMVSATTFTLVGVVNKFGTVLLNVMLWDKHSTGWGIFAVCICLISGSFYQQAPKRDEARRAQPQDKESELPLIRAESGSASAKK